MSAAREPSLFRAGAYTEGLRGRMRGISFEDEAFAEEIIAVGKAFRSFPEAMDEFIARHGYGGDPADGKAKAAFIRERFLAAGIAPPRMEKWDEEGRSVSRETAYRICFAFSLDATETDDFFRRVCCGRGFDCRRREDAVYYCCMLNGWTYADAEEILARTAGTGVNSEGTEEVYTSSVLDDLKQITEKEELEEYLRAQAGLFTVRHRTAYETIRRQWNALAGEGGLLERESRLFYSIRDDPAAEDIRVHPGLSVSDALIALFQLDREPAFRMLEQYKSIAPVLKNLHERIRDSFPNKQGIGKILRNDPAVSYESVRKWLVLLSFCTFWLKKAMAEGHRDARSGDRERCVAAVNSYLTDAGYPELYEGNPYDWLFFWSMADPDAPPLENFRWIWSSLADRMAEAERP